MVRESLFGGANRRTINIRIPMSYTPLPLPQHVPKPLARLVSRVFDAQLLEIHWMLRLAIPDLPPKQQFTHSVVTMLLGVVTGTSSILATIEGEPGKQFIETVRRHFPWDMNPPEGTNELGAANILYEVFRNPIMHAAGLRMKGQRVVKLGRNLRDPRDIESSDYLPTLTFLHLRDDAVVLWVEEFYWSLRQMILNTMPNEDRCHEIALWLQAGRFEKAGATLV